MVQFKDSRGNVTAPIKDAQGNVIYPLKDINGNSLYQEDGPVQHPVKDGNWQHDAQGNPVNPVDALDFNGNPKRPVWATYPFKDADGKPYPNGSTNPQSNPVKDALGHPVYSTSNFAYPVSAETIAVRKKWAIVDDELSNLATDIARAKVKRIDLDSIQQELTYLSSKLGINNNFNGTGVNGFNGTNGVNGYNGTNVNGVDGNFNVADTDGALDRLLAVIKEARIR